MYQVDEGLRLMQSEGDGVFTRHEACQAMARAGLRAIGFELLAADDVASRTVTAARIPDGLDWSAFNKALKSRVSSWRAARASSRAASSASVTSAP